MSFSNSAIKCLILLTAWLWRTAVAYNSNFQPQSQRAVNVFDDNHRQDDRKVHFAYHVEPDQSTIITGEKNRNPTTMTRKSFFSSMLTLAAAPYAAQALPPQQSPSVQALSAPSGQTVVAKVASDPSSLQESISGFVAGAALAGSKTFVKFPLDTATVRLQVPNTEYTLKDLPRLFRGSYDGITLSLLSNIPGGAVFFAVKDATKAGLKQSALFATAPKWLTTSVAVGAALIPYWIVRNPSEVIKVRQQAGIEGYGEGVSAIDAIQKTIQQKNGTAASTLDTVGEFYTGYWENIIYGFPADVIKFVAYEAITDGRKDLSPLEGARAGAISTATAQLLTTPLDVIRNRLMTGKYRSGNSIASDGKVEEKKKNYVQSLVSLAQEEGLSGLFAGSTPRVSKAFLSGAIQFALYEETKQSIAKLLQR